jgi:hypothetical protein
LPVEERASAGDFGNMNWWHRVLRFFPPPPPVAEPEAFAPAEPAAIRIADIRRGDRFVEEAHGHFAVFVALEDAYATADRLGNLAGHEFTAEGPNGTCTFYCATGFEHYASRLSLLARGEHPPTPCRGRAMAPGVRLSEPGAASVAMSGRRNLKDRP